MRLWTLEMKYTQHGVCGEAALKNAMVMVFWKSDGMDKGFQAGPKNPGFFVG